MTLQYQGAVTSCVPWAYTYTNFILISNALWLQLYANCLNNVYYYVYYYVYHHVYYVGKLH